MLRKRLPIFKKSVGIFSGNTENGDESRILKVLDYLREIDNLYNTEGHLSKAEERISEWAAESIISNFEDSKKFRKSILRSKERRVN